MPLEIGSILNQRYLIQAVLGQGGMGSVYQALDQNLDAQVAIKENLFLTDEYARQFQREAVIMASLRHPNLPHVVDYFIISGQGQYLAMDFIEGEDLRERIQREITIPDADVVMVGAAICDALSYLHSRTPPVIHRDVKPGNIKITPEGQVFLVDFGLVKVMEDNQATTTGARAMTPGYSPPEQYGTAHTDHRSDIYSLGATLYAALSGVIPEDGLSRATGKADLTPLHDYLPKINRKLEDVIETALSVEPDDRFQSADDFKVALLEAANLLHLAPRSVAVTPPPDPTQPRRDDTNKKTNPRGKSRTALRRRTRRIVRGVLVTSTIAAVISLVALFYFKPEIPLNAIASILPTPAMPTITATIPVPTNTMELTATLAEPFDATQTLVVVVEPTATDTPSPEPTSTPTATLTPAPTLAAGAEGGELAFTTNRSGSVQIWMMNADGSSQRQLSNIKGGACQIDWSPDGQKILFISPCEVKKEVYSGTKIFMMDADGSNVLPVPIPDHPAGDFDPDWSPDGKQIAFTSMRTGRPHIFVFDIDSGLLEELSNTRFQDIQPDWDPSGKNIAFIRSVTSSQVWIYPTNGDEPWQYSLSGNVNNSNPHWYQDGQAILYSQATVDGTGASWLASLSYDKRQTSAEIRIPPIVPGETQYPLASHSISPDGQWIVFESWPDGQNHDIYRISFDGSNRVRLTKDPGYDFGPVWRPIPAE
jgi:serine/threonine protein kinase